MMMFPQNMLTMKKTTKLVTYNERENVEILEVNE